jgi:hypothetical protein
MCLHAFDHIILSILSLLTYFGSQAIQSHPWTSQVLMQMMHMFRGRMYYNLTLWGKYVCLSDLDIVSEMDCKGNDELGQKKASTALWYQCILFQITKMFSHCPWCFLCNFGKAMGLKGQ